MNNHDLRAFLLGYALIRAGFLLTVFALLLGAI